MKDKNITKIISAKFLNEFAQLVDKYNPDKELQELSAKAGEIIEDKDNKENLQMFNILIQLALKGSQTTARKLELINFNYEAYSLIYGIELEEAQELDYKNVNEKVQSFRNNYSI